MEYRLRELLEDQEIAETRPDHDVVVYLDDNFAPTDAEHATLIKVYKPDGQIIFAVPAPPDEAETGVQLPVESET